MIFDVFTMNNELDLLELRLEMLDPYVDKFVIIECVSTFSRKPKPLHFEENMTRYEKYLHKIHHHVTIFPPESYEDLQQRIQNPQTEDLEKQICVQALTSTNVPPGELHWLNEFYQKEYIRKALLDAGATDQDVIMVGDLDEIWNPEYDYNFIDDVSIYKLKQIVYSGYMNVRSNEEWAGTLVTRYKNIKNSCLNHLRTASKTNYVYIDNAGWHFTFMGGPEQIKHKIQSYGHQEFNNESVMSNVENLLKNNQDVLGRNNFRFWQDELDLPSYIKENRDKYKQFFK